MKPIINKKITIEIDPNGVPQSPDLVRVSAKWMKGGEKQTFVSVFHSDVPLTAYLHVIRKLIRLAMEGGQ